MLPAIAMCCVCAVSVLCLLAIAMCCWQSVPSRGEAEEWRRGGVEERRSGGWEVMVVVVCGSTDGVFQVCWVHGGTWGYMGECGGMWGYAGMGQVCTDPREELDVDAVVAVLEHLEHLGLAIDPLSVHLEHLRVTHSRHRHGIVTGSGWLVVGGGYWRQEWWV